MSISADSRRSLTLLSIHNKVMAVHCAPTSHRHQSLHFVFTIPTTTLAKLRYAYFSPKENQHEYLRSGPSSSPLKSRVTPPFHGPVNTLTQTRCLSSCSTSGIGSKSKYSQVSSLSWVAVRVRVTLAKWFRSSFTNSLGSWFRRSRRCRRFIRNA